MRASVVSRHFRQVKRDTPEFPQFSPQHPSSSSQPGFESQTNERQRSHQPEKGWTVVSLILFNSYNSPRQCSSSRLTDEGPRLRGIIYV